MYVKISICFISGCLVGSFYGVVGQRVPNNESIIWPRSHCTSCGHNLKIIELVPVISFIFLRGKCQKCGMKLSPMYVIEEIVSGVLLSIMYVRFQGQRELLLALTFHAFIIIAYVSNYLYERIPDKLVFFFIVVGVIERLSIPKGLVYVDLLWLGIGGSLVYLRPQQVYQPILKILCVFLFLCGWQRMFLSLFFSVLMTIFLKKMGSINGVKKVENSNLSRILLFISCIVYIFIK